MPHSVEEILSTDLFNYMACDYMSQTYEELKESKEILSPTLIVFSIDATDKSVQEDEYSVRREAFQEQVIEKAFFSMGAEQTSQGKCPIAIFLIAPAIFAPKLEQECELKQTISLLGRTFDGRTTLAYTPIQFEGEFARPVRQPIFAGNHFLTSDIQPLRCFFFGVKSVLQDSGYD